jgi:predicted PurR-regulated permease PerM
MKDKNSREAKLSWFFKWFLNSKAVNILLILLLLFLVVLVFTKVSYLFEPVWQFTAIVGLPIILSLVFYYMLKPIVDLFENKFKWPRVLTIALVFLVLIALIVWGIIVLIPNIQSQTLSFIRNVPSYVHVLDRKTQEIIDMPMLDSFRPQLERMTENISDTVIKSTQDISKNVFDGIGSFIGTVTTIVVGVITMPFILFYLLKDGRKLLPYITGFLPKKWRKQTATVLTEVNDQLSSYIRGQLTVAMAVAIMFMLGFNIIGLDYAVTLGIAAGFLNLIPYLGSFLAMVPAVLLGLVAGPWMLVKVLIVFVIEQTLEGRVISPLVLGSQLSIHPVTILLVLLTSGKIGGVVGVIIGIPVYAVMKVLVTHIYEWYRDVSGLYDDEKVETTPPIEENVKES